MKKCYLAFLAVVCLCAGLAAAEPQSVILKLDDFDQHPDPNVAVLPEWQKLYDFFVERDIRGSAGVFGASLERDNPACFQWIRDKEQSGRFEFWNHGYQSPRRTLPDGKLEPGQFERGYEEQKQNLVRCQALWRKRFGKPFSVWGPHWSSVNADTARALREDPAIRIVFERAALGKPIGKVNFEQAVRLEYQTGKVDFEKFRNAYLAHGQDVPLLVLQGHPWGWRNTRSWDEFVKVIDFLQARGCRFVTPTGYHQ